MDKTKITLIPAIDIINGQCVRLTKGAFESKKVYASDPVMVAKEFEQAGFKRLHLVDLDGARAKQVVNVPVLAQIKQKTNLVVDFGGGIQSQQTIRQVFEAGADMITIGSIAVKQPDLMKQWLQQFGGERIILGADVKGESIAIHGWQEETQLNIFDFLESYRKAGIKMVICTDVEQDGMLQGPNLQLYQNLQRHFADLEIIASGGVKDIDDFYKLQKMGINGVIFGKAFYEGRIKPNQLKEFL